MTRNWPMAEAADEEHDHPHHKSFWWGHGDMNGVDFWAEGKDAGKTVHEEFTAVESGEVGVIKSRNKYVSKEGKTIAIFSSGSVLAQKLIFKYSNSGDLSGFISNYFDTNIGGKKEAESYVKIAAALNHPPKRIAFVSDILAELDAARNAGMHTVLAMREGNGQITEDFSHRSINSFDELE
jgi:2,3-diketo-5-methylthio-1-phosphopentane phosphatase